MLFIALASATMQHYAMIILIPFMCTHDHSSIQSYEIGILIAAATAGELISRRFTEPSISKLGTRYAIQLGFFLMVVGSFAFWLVSYITNDSNFTSLAFLARFIFGCGSGLLRSIVIVAHALSKKSDQTMQAKDYLRFNFIGESFGYFLGPLVMVLTNHSRWENERTCMWFAIINFVIWLVFSVTFYEGDSADTANRLKLLETPKHLKADPDLEDSDKSMISQDESKFSLGAIFNGAKEMRTKAAGQADNLIKSLMYK